MHKVLIVDDEKLSRDTVKLLLKKHSVFKSILEADNGKNALTLVKMHFPDIIFLDIEMPSMSGIELARLLPCKTAVIFITAYDEYAVSAFELNAVDYLLKPFEESRFKQAIEKALHKLEEAALKNQRKDVIV